METKIYKDYNEFLTRENQTENGVPQQFTDRHKNWAEMNETNVGCWNCDECSGCNECNECNECYRCKNKKGVINGN